MKPWGKLIGDSKERQAKEIGIQNKLWRGCAKHRSIDMLPFSAQSRSVTHMSCGILVVHFGILRTRGLCASGAWPFPLIPLADGVGERCGDELCLGFIQRSDESGCTANSEEASASGESTLLDVKVAAENDHSANENDAYVLLKLGCQVAWVLMSKLVA